MKKLKLKLAAEPKKLKLKLKKKVIRPSSLTIEEGKPIKQLRIGSAFRYTQEETQYSSGPYREYEVCKIISDGNRFEGWTAHQELRIATIQVPYRVAPYDLYRILRRADCLPSGCEPNVIFFTNRKEADGTLSWWMVDDVSSQPLISLYAI